MFHCNTINLNISSICMSACSDPYPLDSIHTHLSLYSDTFNLHMMHIFYFSSHNSCFQDIVSTYVFQQTGIHPFHLCIFHISPSPNCKSYFQGMIHTHILSYSNISPIYNPHKCFSHSNTDCLDTTHIYGSKSCRLSELNIFNTSQLSDLSRNCLQDMNNTFFR